MRICGIQKTSLVDWPGHIATVIFTGGCNFSCPYCHNSGLIPMNAEPIMTTGDTLKMLRTRYHLIDSVVISGGEPTLQPDLIGFCKEVKKIGLKIKLDTNGSNPDILKKLVEDKLVDYVAMDVKDAKGWYGTYIGYELSHMVHDVDISISYLKQAGIPYEFRTTAVEGLHTLDDFEQIGKWIKDAERYYIQNFRAADTVPALSYLKPFSEAELKEFASIVRPYVKEVQLRGI